MHGKGSPIWAVGREVPLVEGNKLHFVHLQECRRFSVSAIPLLGARFDFREVPRYLQFHRWMVSEFRRDDGVNFRSNKNERRKASRGIINISTKIHSKLLPAR